MKRILFFIVFSVSLLDNYVWGGATEEGKNVSDLIEQIEELKIQQRLQDQKFKELEIRLERQGTKLQQLQSDVHVAFYAYVSNPMTLTSGSIVVFDTTVTNIGGGYLNKTGVFQAPVDGVYSLTVFALLDGFTNTMLVLWLNDLRLLCATFTPVSHWDSTGTCSAVVRLSAGDLVFVTVTTKDTTPEGVRALIHGDGSSGFTGMLLVAM